MKKLLALIPFILTACSTIAPKQPASPPPTQAAAAETPALGNNKLDDINDMIFACPKAALNAAAREAKKAPSLGSYQFSFFRIADNSHHAQYEVHFESNVHDEPELKYCVSLYCQQGWDPKTAKTTVQLMNDKEPPSGRRKATAYESNCGLKPPSS